MSNEKKSPVQELADVVLCKKPLTLKDLLRGERSAGIRYGPLVQIYQKSTQTHDDPFALAYQNYLNNLN